MTDAEPAVTVNDLVRDHNLAFVEIIEKVKEGGAINAASSNPSSKQSIASTSLTRGRSTR